MRLTITVVNRRGDRRVNYHNQTIHVEAADWNEFQRAVSEAERAGDGDPVEKTKLRYVEIDYELPGTDQTRWWAMIVESPSPSVAVEEAIAALRREHPDAVKVEMFMTHVVTPRKATRIEEAMQAGTWTGWKFVTR